MRLRTIAWVATIFSGLSGAIASAQMQSTPTDAAATADQGDNSAPAEDIVVTGQLPEVSSSIDSRVYSLRDDPQAQSAPILDVLGRIPSVSVTPSGQVLLLGNARVTILIDGEPPSNPNALRTLPAARIDRVEIMTNPGARNSAEGTAGIINLITRERSAPGITGTVITSIASDGGAVANFAPSLTRGAFTIDGSLGYSSDRTRSRTRRRNVILASGDETIEDQQLRGQLDQADASLSLTYAPTDSHTFTVGLEGSIADPWSDRGIARIEGTAAGFETYTESTRSLQPLQTWRLSADYEWRSRLEGESLSASAYFDRSDWDASSESVSDFDDPLLIDSAFLTRSSFEDDITSLKLDYRRPFGETIAFEAGASWVRTESLIATARTTLSGTPPGADFSRQIEGRRDILAGYAALQIAFDDWTIKPGVRIEDQRFDINSGGIAADNDHFDLFPSFAIERRLSPALKLNVSYSQRTTRPNLQQLDPALIYLSATAARFGNPDLEPESTDAFEARLTYQQAGRNLMLTFYNRESSDVFAALTQRSGELYSTTTVNAGEMTSRGAEISWRAPFGDHWRYALTTNLFWREQDVVDGALIGRDDSFSYSGSAQIDYSFAGNGDTSADQLQFSVRFAGPRRLFQGETDGYVTADAVWRRPLTPRLSAVLSVSDIFESASDHARIETADFISQSDVTDLGRVFKLTLSYRFGGDNEAE